MEKVVIYVGKHTIQPTMEVTQHFGTDKSVPYETALQLPFCIFGNLAVYVRFMGHNACYTIAIQKRKG